MELFTKILSPGGVSLSIQMYQTGNGLRDKLAQGRSMANAMVYILYRFILDLQRQSDIHLGAHCLKWLYFVSLTR